MICKTFEVRDRGTFIPVLAVKLTPADDRDRWLLARAGFGSKAESQSTYVVVYSLVKDEAHYDPYKWDTMARTYRVAHNYIIEAFDDLQNGQVVCVEHILGERETPKLSEQIESYPA